MRRPSTGERASPAASVPAPASGRAASGRPGSSAGPRACRATRTPGSGPVAEVQASSRWPRASRASAGGVVRAGGAAPTAAGCREAVTAGRGDPAGHQGDPGRPGRAAAAVPGDGRPSAGPGDDRGGHGTGRPAGTVDPDRRRPPAAAGGGAQQDDAAVGADDGEGEAARRVHGQPRHRPRGRPRPADGEGPAAVDRHADDRAAAGEQRDGDPAGPVGDQPARDARAAGPRRARSSCPPRPRVLRATRTPPGSWRATRWTVADDGGTHRGAGRGREVGVGERDRGAVVAGDRRRARREQQRAGPSRRPARPRRRGRAGRPAWARPRRPGRPAAGPAGRRPAGRRTGRRRRCGRGRRRPGRPAVATPRRTGRARVPRGRGRRPGRVRCRRAPGRPRSPG